MEINLTINRSNDVAVVLPNTQQVNTVVEPRNNITVSAVSSVSLSNITNLNELSINNIADIGDLALGDLSDVSTENVQDEQVLAYNADTQTYEFTTLSTITGSEHVKENTITVNNPDAAFTQIRGTQYTPGKKIEEILKDILETYVRPSISFQSYRYAYGSGGEEVPGASTTHQGAASFVVEVGTTLVIDNVWYYITDPEKVLENSAKLQLNGSDIVTNLPTDSVQVQANFEESQFILYNTQPAYSTLRMQIFDNGGGSVPSSWLNSNTKSISWRWAVKFGTSTEASPSRLSDIYETMNTDDMVSGFYDSNANIGTTGNDRTNTEGVYCWLVFPSDWTINTILQGAVEVDTDFVHVGEANVRNAQGVTKEYSFYRTVDDAPFGPTSNITIDFL